VQLPSRPPEPPPTPQTAVVGGEVSRGDPNSRRIALTFDAGWEFKPVDDILEALARHNVRATFFLTGRWVEKNPELTRRIAAEGHEIGNHTYSHRRLTELSDGEIAKEAERTEQLVLKTAGLSTEPLLRVPYGDRNKRVLSVLKEQGYQSIFWDVDSWDGYKKGITSAEIERRVLTKTRNGSIVLMHCGSQATADALDSILQKLTDAGYEPVTVSELLGA
jgi:peptidoglycan/xylan/chitin deacetylase (PgdA/CDA1 family)